jgi:hypothetical protein
MGVFAKYIKIEGLFHKKYRGFRISWNFGIIF